MKANTGLGLVLHAFAIWLGCGLTVAIGRGPLGLNAALELHAIVAPGLAGLVSLVYFSQFGSTSPLLTAVFFVAFIVIIDAAFVAPVFEKSYAMFGSVLGTWLPFLLIFLATYLTGIWIRGRERQDDVAHKRW